MPKEPRKDKECQCECNFCKNGNHNYHSSCHLPQEKGEEVISKFIPPPKEPTTWSDSSPHPQEEREGWEAEFDKLCTGKSGNMTWAIDGSKLKDFTKNLLKEEKDKLQAMIKEIEGLKKEEMTEKNWPDTYNRAWNSALDKVLSILKGDNI